MTNNIPRKTKARHATAQSPWPVLGSAAACVVVGLVFLVVLVAGVLMDADAGLASDLGDESGVGAESSLGLFSSLCFPSLPGFVSPAGLPPAGSSVPGWVFPRRRQGARGFNYHTQRYGPAGVHHAGGTKGPARRRHKLRGRK